jgi:hypothetical protein
VREERLGSLRDVRRDRLPLAPLVTDALAIDADRERIRARYRNGLVPRSQIRQLEQLPGWSWSTRQEKRHEDALALLRKFVKAHGHARVPARAVVEGMALGTWVKHRRQEWRRGELSSGLAKRLQALPGWRWKLRVGHSDNA